MKINPIKAFKKFDPIQKDVAMLVSGMVFSFGALGLVINDVARNEKAEKQEEMMRLDSIARTNYELGRQAVRDSLIIKK